MSRHFLELVWRSDLHRPRDANVFVRVVFARLAVVSVDVVSEREQFWMEINPCAAWLGGARLPIPTAVVAKLSHTRPVYFYPPSRLQLDSATVL